MTNARQLTFKGLCAVNLNGGFSNLTLDNLLKNIKDFENPEKDSAFVSALFYGVIERKLTLDYFIKKISKLPIEKIDKKCLILLEMGIYQIIYMTSVPESAAVNETVELCKKENLHGIKNFINANLRSFLRKINEYEIKKSNFKSTDEYFSIKYSINQPLAKLLIEQYGEEKTQIFLEKSNKQKNINIKINTLEIDAMSYEKMLDEHEYNYKKSSIIENCFSLTNQSDIKKLPGFYEGFFFVQDIASQICVKAIEPKKNMRIIDCCSAPGSKAFSMAIEMENQGEILAFDLHKKRVNFIAIGAKKLGLTIIKPMEKNANIFDKTLKNTADIVLCDVPCSGLGTIGRKPEIKYKDILEIQNLYEIQQKILFNCCKYVKINGSLIYSTCSINKNENELIIDAFLKNNKDFIIDKIHNDLEFLTDKTGGRITLFADKIESDGFFICKMKRIS